MTRSTLARIATKGHTMTEQERRYQSTLAFAIRIAEATIAAKGVPAWKKAQAAERLAELRTEVR